MTVNPHTLASSVRAELADPTGAQRVTFKQPGAGGLARSLDAILRDQVLLATNFPVDRTGASFTADACQQFMDQAAGSRRIAFFPRGTYKLDKPLLNRGVAVVCEPGTRFVRVGPGPCFQTPATIPTGNGRWLTVDAPAGARQLALASVAGLVVNSTVILAQLGTQLSEWPEGPDAFAEFVRIEAIDGTTVTLSTPLLHGYTVAARPLGTAGAEVMTVTFTQGVSYEGVDIQMDPTAADLPGVHAGIDCLFADAPRFRDVTISQAVFAGILLTGCRDATIENPVVRDFLSADDDVSGGFGYGVAEQGLNVDTVISGLRASRCRHAYTTLAGSPAPGRWRYGMPMGTQVNGTARDMKAAAWDTHPAGWDITFDTCKAIGSKREALQIRCRGVRVYDFFGRDCQRGGILISHSNADGAHLAGVHLVNTNLTPGYWEAGALHVHEADGLHVSGLRVDGCAGPAVFAREIGVLDLTLHQVSVRDANRQSISQAAVVLAQNAATDTCRIDGLHVRGSGRTAHAVQRTGAGGFDPALERISGTGLTGALVI